MPYYVYELIDPRTNVTAYIGITYNADLRLQQHIHDNTNTKKSLWIQDLRYANLAPCMRIIEELDTKEAVLERERYWIQHYISLGIPLANTLLIVPRPHREHIDKTQVFPLPKRNFYTSKEAQELLGVNTHAFYNMVRSGKITKLLIPGRELGVYPKAQVDKLAHELTLTNATASRDVKKKLKSSTVKKPKLPEDLYTTSQAMEKLGISPFSRVGIF